MWKMGDGGVKNRYPPFHFGKYYNHKNLHPCQWEDTSSAVCKIFHLSMNFNGSSADYHRDCNLISDLIPQMKDLYVHHLVGIASLLSLCNTSHYQHQNQHSAQAWDQIKQAHPTSCPDDKDLLFICIKKLSKEALDESPTDRKVENIMCKLGWMISDKGQDNKFKDLIDPDFPLIKWTSKGLVDLVTSANIGRQLLTVSHDGQVFGVAITCFMNTLCP